MRAIFFCALLSGFSGALIAAPQLVLSATSVNFGPFTPGAANGAAQNVEAKNAGDGSLNLSATATAPWLAALVAAPGPCKVLSGTCNQIAITILTTPEMAAGTYTEFILLSDPAAIDSPQQIAVTVTLAGVPDSLTFYVGPAGSGTSSASSFIYPASAVSGAVSTTSGGNWLSFTPQGVGFILSTANTIEVVAQAGQAAGTYHGTVTIGGSSLASDNKTIAVTLIVSALPAISPLTTTQIYGYQGGTTTFYLTVPAVAGAGSAALNITGGSASAAFLSVAAYTSDTIAITADATNLSPGVYRGAVTLDSNAANNSAVSAPVDFIVYPASANVITYNGVVNPATYVSEPFAPGEIAALFGTNLAAPGTSALNPGPPPLAASLGKTQVLVNGSAVPLYYVSPGQINFQVPYSLSVGQTATVQVVSDGAPGNVRPMTITAYSPRILVFQGNYGVAFNLADGSFPLPSSVVIPGYVCHPAKPGDVLEIFGVGFGQTTPGAVEAEAATASPLEYAAPTGVNFGNGFLSLSSTVIPDFSGLTPTAVGLYQINVKVPEGTILGSAVPVSVTVAEGISGILAPASSTADAAPVSFLAGIGLSNSFAIAISANGQ